MDAGFAASDVVREEHFRCPAVTHAAMEPHSTLASFEIDSQSGNPGRLIVWSSTQVPYYLQHKLSLVLEMPMSQIRVIKPLVGIGEEGPGDAAVVVTSTAIKKDNPGIANSLVMGPWTHGGWARHDGRRAAPPGGAPAAGAAAREPRPRRCRGAPDWPLCRSRAGRTARRRARRA